MTRRKFRLQGGFNLVELMVVVAIIGILTSVAVPKFATFKARAQQTEARSSLNGVFLAMQAYQANYNAFIQFSPAANPTGAGIGFALQGNNPKYNVLMITENVALPNGWSATASSRSRIANGAFDHWRINTNKWLCNSFDAVTNTAATLQNTGTTATADRNCPQVGAAATASLAPTYIAATDQQ